MWLCRKCPEHIRSKQSSVVSYSVNIFKHLVRVLSISGASEATLLRVPAERLAFPSKGGVPTTRPLRLPGFWRLYSRRGLTTPFCRPLLPLVWGGSYTPVSLVVAFRGPPRFSGRLGLGPLERNTLLRPRAAAESLPSLWLRSGFGTVPKDVSRSGPLLSEHTTEFTHRHSDIHASSAQGESLPRLKLSI